jgi:hypothetical protein
MSVIHPSRSFDSLSYRFCLSTWLLIFCLGYFVCRLGLLCNFSDNFVHCLSPLDQGHSFDVIIYHLIPLLAIYSNASYHLLSLHVICCGDL